MLVSTPALQAPWGKARTFGGYCGHKARSMSNRQIKIKVCAVAVTTPSHAAVRFQLYEKVNFDHFLLMLFLLECWFSEVPTFLF